MFRSTKKKPKNRGALRRKDDDSDDDAGGNATEPRVETVKDGDNGDGGDDEDEDEGPPIVIRRHKDKSKRKESRKRGLNIMAGDDSKKTKKKKSSGLGFGGMTTVIDEDENDTFPTEVEAQEYITPSYGKEALEELKAAQKTAKPKELVEDTEARQTESSTIPEPQAEGDLDAMPEKSKEILKEKLKERNFIPLHEDPDDVAHTTSLLDEDGNPITFLEGPDDDQDWEDQIAKRAGIQPSAPKTRTVAPIASLDMLRDNLQSTIQNLEAREEDISNAMMRREADLAQTRSDCQRQKSSIEEAGKACSDYQQLRLDLANWVGALRDLEEKVSPIQQSLIEMLTLQFETSHKEWLNWQDDICITLEEFGRLERVLGRTPQDLGAQDTDGGVDEFGRDIGSQKRRDRNIRFTRRSEKRVKLPESQTEDLALSYLWTKEEEASRRFDILQEALRVAVEDLDDDFSNDKALVNCFTTWKAEYQDEYKQCYADLSLVQLLHVFDQVDFCKASWIRGLIKVHEEMSFGGRLYCTTSMRARDRDESDTSAGSSIDRCLRKQLVPFILEVLREYPSVVFLSDKMSKFISIGISDLIRQIGFESESSRSICDAIVDGSKNSMQSLSIPLLRSGTGLDSDDRLVDSMEFTKKELPNFAQGLILNVLRHWMPLLEKAGPIQYKDLGKHSLAFLSETYLFYLSSLPAGQVKLAPIWNVLVGKYRALLESPEFILQSAPLRAAANAYGLKPLDGF